MSTTGSGSGAGAARLSGDTIAAIDSAIHAIVEPGQALRIAESLSWLKIRPESAPAWLVHPGSATEVAELIGLASRHGIAVIPIGNQARAPRAADLDDRMRLFIDSRRMNHVLYLDETSLVAHVQCGLTGLALEKVLTPRGLSLGDYPPVVLGSTIGGLLSVRTPGKLSARHGFVEDAVLGVSAVLASSRTIHTRVAPRRSTGPDLCRALCGSEGTLGFITSAVLRIHRVPEARFLASYILPDFASALTAVHLALRDEAAPTAVRVYDAVEARAHFGPGAGSGQHAVLVAATAGPSDLAACDRDLITSAVEAMGGKSSSNKLAEIWWRRRTGRDVDRAIPLPALQVTASPGKQKAVYRAVCDAVAGSRQPASRVRAHASRFERDGAVLFFTFTDATGQDVLSGSELAHIRAVAEDAAGAAGAILLDSTNPSLVPYLEELRRVLDPGGIMNPGALRPSAAKEMDSAE